MFRIGIEMEGVVRLRSVMRVVVLNLLRMGMGLMTTTILTFLKLMRTCPQLTSGTYPFNLSHSYHHTPLTNPIKLKLIRTTHRAPTPFGRKKGILHCPTTEDSECYMRYHRTCEAAGFLPSPSMATEICYNREGCTCTRILIEWEQRSGLERGNVWHV